MPIKHLIDGTKMVLGLQPVAAPIQWDSIGVSNRILILKETISREKVRIKSRLRHKIIYGRWIDLGKKTQDMLYLTDWISVINKSYL